jgi:hypothetical protein
METSAYQAGDQDTTGLRTPSVPIPPPRAGQIALEEFIESATRAVVRALGSQEITALPDPAATPRPKPRPRPPIIVGIVVSRPRPEV